MTYRTLSHSLKSPYLQMTQNAIIPSDAMMILQEGLHSVGLGLTSRELSIRNLERSFHKTFQEVLKPDFFHFFDSSALVKAILIFYNTLVHAFLYCSIDWKPCQLGDIKILENV